MHGTREYSDYYPGEQISLVKVEKRGKGIAQ